MGHCARVSFICVSLFMLVVNGLNAEIMTATITWNSTACNEKCAGLLKKEFQKMREIEEVSVNPAAGVSILKWKPKARFSYHSIKRTMQMVGVGINDIRVRVRGKAREQGKQVSLISLEDNTKFVLVSPVLPEQGKYTTLPNPYFMELSPELRERILLEAKEDKILVIEGPLYQPARSPPLQLVVERIQIEKKKK